MIEIEIEVGDFPAEGLMQAIDRGARVGLAFGAERIVDLAKLIAPQGGGRDKLGGGVGLADSIQSLPPTGSFINGDLEARVAAGAPHAIFVEFGTGIYRYPDPGQPWFVAPVKKKVLRWETPGGYAYSAGHWVDGMESQPFLSPAMKVSAQQVAQDIGDAIELELLKMQG